MRQKLMGQATVIPVRAGSEAGLTGLHEPRRTGHAGLPATLILASRVFRSRLGGREWACVVVMAAALASMLFALSPSAGQTSGVR